MRALLDGDIYAFRPASTTDELGIAIWRMEEMIDNTLAETGADEFSIFLSGENNFRYDIYPEYKANRTQPKPPLLRALKDYLIEKYNAQVSDGCEADDLLGIEQCNPINWLEEERWNGDEHRDKYSNTIICSIDKDLRMIPGNHYSFEISGKVNGKTWVRPAEKVFVEPFDGLRRFYTQCLTGDSTDNVKGAAGIGKVKAERILAECQTEAALFDATRACFSTDDELLMTGRCLWIFRKPNDIWEFPTFETTERESKGA